MKKAAFAVALCLLAPVPASAAGPVRSDPVLESLLSVLDVERRGLGEDAEDLERISSRLARNEGRATQAAYQLAQLVRDGSVDRMAIDNLVDTLADADARRQADRDLRAQVASRIADRARHVRLLREEINRRRAVVRVTDPLTGRWDVQVNPGPRRGTMRLVLDGTLISGDYTLDGNFRGSVRGTLVGDKVTLQRIDSLHGFDATFYGKLIQVPTRRLIGSWEATTLAPATGPTAGTWVGSFVPEEADEKP